MCAKQSRDISLVMTSFYLKIVGMWLAKDRSEECRRMAAMIYTVWVLCLAMSFEIRDLYYTWGGDFGELIYVMCTIMTAVMVLFKILVLFWQKKKFLELVAYPKKNFWHSNYDCYERMVINNCSRTCTYFICIFNFFAQSTVISYAIWPIMENVGRNESDRMHPFNMHIDVLTKSPYFEMMFVVQVLTAYHIGVGYLCLDNFLCVINLHVASQFRILQYRFVNIHTVKMEEKSKEASDSATLYHSNKCHDSFKRCIKQHQALLAYGNKLEEVFAVVVLGQVVLFSLLMCLDGYLILLGELSEARRLIFVIHIAGCMCQLLMFTYSCDCLIRESTRVASAVYTGPWLRLPMNEGGRMLRKDMLFVIMRSRVSCCLTANGFFVVSLETYTKVLSTAISYFTLLRSY
ncbi:odorant receptor 13a-like [Hylaeus anthracinus]|uniref:odorant receptor 13a-like n=1 Tax=Hylaeus anthracinus TaxID=313031 RepID=UPI0023B9CA90|nr:odorant receptor 13a-like [Hylaeus anthracinus]